MNEPLRRITLEAELSVDLAEEIEQARRSGDGGSVAEAVESALAVWSHDRWKHVDPEDWSAHVAEIQRRVDEAEAHPEICISIEQVRADLEAEFGSFDEERAAS